MSFIITGSCCNDSTCVSVCPVNCIHPTPAEPDFGTAEMLYIDAKSCISCGACALVCPAEAIIPEWSMPPAAEPYQAINAMYYAEPAHQNYVPLPEPMEVPTLADQGRTPGPLRVAVVGSGPSGAYAAQALCERGGASVEVSLFERLPSPWGLAQFGIAPDHQSTKAVIKSFERTIRRPNVHLYLNVDVGEDILHAELLDHHHAVIYAVGANRDRSMGIPKEELPGSESATKFVAWYNGHPDMCDASFDLSCERAIIVGNGNVAMDVARVLASDINDLAKTDIAGYALEALSESRIEEIVVLGRRGLAQAAYTLSELIGITQLQNAEVVVYPDELGWDDANELPLNLEPNELTRHKAEIVSKLPSALSLQRKAKRIVLRYRVSPVEVLGSTRVDGLHVVQNDLAIGSTGAIVAVPSRRVETLPAGLVLRAIGYTGEPIRGLPFDETNHRLPTRHGRIVDPASGHSVPGAYATGWVKRGSTGYLGTNRGDAQETVSALIADHVSSKLQAPPRSRTQMESLLDKRRRPLPSDPS